MFERFTAHARHAVVLAQEEARRLNHNYIGTEHVLLGLLGERDGIGCQVLESMGLSRDVARQEVTELVGTGKEQPSGHIPFTPRAKKALELSLREALALHHNYIGSEHLLLGLMRESDGVACQVMRKHADLLAIRTAVLDAVPAGEGGGGEWGGTALRWLRRRVTGSPGRAAQSDEESLHATPAADATLTEASRLAGSQPVGSHHLLLAALADGDCAAARALAALGVDLNQARDALRDVDVTGTTDEQPEVAGSRQMVIRVAQDSLTIEAADPVIVAAGQAALAALGKDAGETGEIRGDQGASAFLSAVWLALREGLAGIERNAGPSSSEAA